MTRQTWGERRLDASLAATVHRGDGRIVALPAGFTADHSAEHMRARAGWSSDECAELEQALRRALPVAAYAHVDVIGLADALIVSGTVVAPGALDCGPYAPQGDERST